MSSPSLLPLLSSFLGWSYFLLWSASFWPQTLLLLKRRTSAGLSSDFVLLNTLGFFCYTLTTLALFGNARVREEYALRHGGQYPEQHTNDVAFAVHGLVLCVAQAIMAAIFPKAPGQNVARWAWSVFGLLSTALILAGIVATASDQGDLPPGDIGDGNPDEANLAGWRWIDFIWVCSSIKLIITILKWLPQIALNYRRRSTRGFAVTNVILDLGGGILSLAQIAVDARILGSWRAVTGDPGKIGLSLLTLIFDVIIIWQHYVLYGPAIVQDEGALNYDWSDERRREEQERGLNAEARREVDVEDERSALLGN
ncbi:hypothetical protein IE81DRAFT_342801 [Ceraceosorus guamensis]|uniref:PQ-loop-domain-containing protein n=1 Tax=Ceraceosorus guamensis TaxID=1522189 RepID=A0A316VSY2_9BASI|nr:hypothetical protein IE81DRAFT_342801 [Ceraceosorus guamensis]PWN40334.1 hypothetical protein IE81DRAFT_342801 [Ceraceosorus guamensis]